MKKVIRKIVPYSVRHLIWSIIPKIELLNTYLLQRDNLITELSPIDSKFEIRTVTDQDWFAIKNAVDTRGSKTFRQTIPNRMKHPDWIGIIVVNTINKEIAYLSWIISQNIQFFKEFGIKPNNKQFFLKDIYVVPKYRKQGLNKRMEQERINYCINNGAKEIFIQIHQTHPIMNKIAVKNGYKLYNQKWVMHWPIFNVYRALNAFLKRPFQKIIK